MNTKNAKQLLIACDLDGTLIPVADSSAHKEAVMRFNELVSAHRHSQLVYATGRHFEYALEGMKRGGLKNPKFLVCDVGASVFRSEGDSWKTDKLYQEKLRATWPGDTGNELVETLKDAAELSPQEQKTQGEFKRSYYAAADIERDVIKQRIHELLSKKNIPVNIVYSIDIKRNVALVDLVPKGVSKQHALEYLSEELSISVNQVVYAGDSGNDLDALLAGFRGIVPGNAREAFKDELREKSRLKNLDGHIYYSTSHYAEGVVEGLKHHGVLNTTPA